MTTAIDWEALATRLGLLNEGGESSSGEAARQALEIIIGEDALRTAVDYYIAQKRGAELARSVLWKLHPWSAMQRCYEIYKQDSSEDKRESALELLNVVADRRVIPWIHEFLADPDIIIQALGIRILDQLLFSELVEANEVEDLLCIAERIDDKDVRQQTKFIRRYLKKRKK